MATIALNGNTFGCALGMGTFENVGTAFSNAKKSTGLLSEALSSLKTKLEIATVAAKIDTSQEQAKKAQECEAEKKSALTLAYEKLETFISDVGIIDQRASDKIDQRKDDFYNRYNYLKPECEKSLQEKWNDYWAEKWRDFKDFWGGVGEAIAGVAKNVGDWCKEHWKELLIGLVFIVVGAIITCLTGGATLAVFLAALAKGIATAVVAGIATGALNAGITYGLARLSGASHEQASSFAKSAFGDGFAAGFMMGGVGFAGGAFGKAFGTTYKTFRAIQYTAKISGSVSVSMIGFDLASQISGIMNPNSKVYSANQSLHENEVYNCFQSGITALAIFSGAAYKTAEITDGTHMYRNANGEMVPRSHVKYAVGKDGVKYHYVTGGKDENGAGLIKSAYAEQLQLKPEGRNRYTNDSNTPGKLAGDDAGHIFADRFSGSNKLDNLTSQAKDVNRSVRGEYTYYSMEQQWAEAIKNGNNVTNVKIKINYGFGSSRPSLYKVKYYIDGELFRTIFKNINISH